MENVVVPVINYIIWFVPALIIIAVFSYRRYTAIAAAERIVRDQYNKASDEQMEGFLSYSESRGKKERGYALMLKARVELGHEGIKVGHIFWFLKMLDDKSPVDEIKVPRFDLEAVNDK